MLLLAALSFSFLFLTLRFTPEFTSVTIRSKYFIYVLLFFVSVTILFSRLPYISLAVSVGAGEARLDSSVGGGGIYSLITMFAYPLVMISAFCEKKQYQFCFAICCLLWSTDLFFLATRGNIVFTSLFHVVIRSTSPKSIIMKALALLPFLLVIFAYTVQTRSGGSIESIAEYWSQRIYYLQVNQSSSLSENVDILISVSSFLAVPLFLVSYIGHSVVEFRYFIFESNTFAPLLLSLRYFLGLYSFGFLGDHVSSLQILESLYVRPGLYSTAYSSFWIEYGILFVVFMPLLLANPLGPIASLCARLYLALVFSTSLVNNYLLGGLGPLRFLLFVVISCLMLRHTALPRSLSRIEPSGS